MHFKTSLTQFRPSSALDKVEERDGKFYYQNVALTNFNDAKESAKVSKSKLLEKIMREMQTRMEAAENFNGRYYLELQGWERMNEDGEDLEFADDCVADLFEQFKEPLLKGWHEWLSEQFVGAVAWPNLLHETLP